MAEVIRAVCRPSRAAIRSGPGDGLGYGSDAADHSAAGAQDRHPGHRNSFISLFKGHQLVLIIGIFDLSASSSSASPTQLGGPNTRSRLHLRRLRVLGLLLGMSATRIHGAPARYRPQR
jgi:hypothetical protein